MAVAAGNEALAVGGEGHAADALRDAGAGHLANEREGGKVAGLALGWYSTRLRHERATFALALF